ncbi:hypothetical protein GCM10022402_22290 [Salinactinospora qingdaonensis]|uniref:HPP transmembrane region domain-containing protein n=2 Tax=Salinactinospora qingdaonensis TaxID=702744 RepID=A0ABP7FKB8_9ACTN
MGHRPKLERQGLAASAGALLILPPFMALTHHLSLHTELKFLLFPPLASLGYRAFRTPWGTATQFRSVVVAPTLGSVCGLALNTWIGLNAPAIAFAVIAGILLVDVLRADAPPTLAVSVLVLLATDPGWAFPLSVLAATSGLYLIFLVWRRLLTLSPSIARACARPRARGEPRAGGHRRPRRGPSDSSG